MRKTSKPPNPWVALTHIGPSNTWFVLCVGDDKDTREQVRQGGEAVIHDWYKATQPTSPMAEVRGPRKRTQLSVGLQHETDQNEEEREIASIVVLRAQEALKRYPQEVRDFTRVLRVVWFENGFPGLDE